MKAWYSINEEYAAWFPTITKTNEKPSGNYGGTQWCSNTLTDNGKTIIEINHANNDCLEDGDLENWCVQHRLVFGRIEGRFVFLGVFDSRHLVRTNKIIHIHEKIADGINLETFELYTKICF